MKALLTDKLPIDKGPQAWAYEIKWDGVRALSFYDGISFKLFSRNHKDATFRYPEIAQLKEALGNRSAILDGEIIALDSHGNPSFPELQKRMNVTRPDAVARAARQVPIAYVLFDVLYLDGQDLRPLLWEQRRQRLEGLAPLLPPACRLSPVTLGSHHNHHGGRHMLDIAQEKNLEGVIAKKIDSLYQPGQRSGAWIKFKLVQQQELVIGGWVPEVSIEGKLRPDHIGAILLGYYDAPNSAPLSQNGLPRRGPSRFHFAGAVGTGFTHQSSTNLVQKLKPLHSDHNPFDDSVPLRKFRAPLQFVKPEIVAQIEFRRWPAGGLMHQAAFKGLRSDKAAKDVVREIPAEPT